MKFFLFSAVLLVVLLVQTSDARRRYGKRIATDGSAETGKDKREKCTDAEVCREFRETGKVAACPEAKTCRPRWSNPCLPLLCDGTGRIVCYELEHLKATSNN